jgi:Arc/MetJ-type ribon-helix-helix transcriptional regulator
MPEVKGQDGRQLDRDSDQKARATEHDRPLPFDALLLELDDLLEHIVAKALISSEATNDPSFPRVVIRVAQELIRHWRDDVESGSARASMPGESAARIESAWRRAMIEAQGWAPRVSSSVDEEKGAADVPVTEPAVDLSNITLPDDIQRLLRNRVESGQFPSQEALIEAALRSFLIEKPAQEDPEKDRAAEPQQERLPSPFILDEWVFGPGDIPRSGGQKVRCRFLRDEARWPDRFPGE